MTFMGNFPRTIYILSSWNKIRIPKNKISFSTKEVPAYIHQKVSDCPKDHSSLPFIILMSHFLLLLSSPALSSNMLAFHSSTKHNSVISWHNNLHIDVSNRRYKLSTIKIGPHLIEPTTNPVKEHKPKMCSERQPPKQTFFKVQLKANARRRRRRKRRTTSGRPECEPEWVYRVPNGAAALRVHYDERRIRRPREMAKKSPH